MRNALILLLCCTICGSATAGPIIDFHRGQTTDTLRVSNSSAPINRFRGPGKLELIEFRHDQAARSQRYIATIGGGGDVTFQAQSGFKENKTFQGRLNAQYSNIIDQFFAEQSAIHDARPPAPNYYGSAQQEFAIQKNGAPLGLAAKYQNSSISWGMGIIIEKMLMQSSDKDRGYNCFRIQRNPPDRIEPTLKLGTDIKTNHQITEFGVEHTMPPTRYHWPAYTVQFFADGHVEFEGYSDIEPIGKHTGRINPNYFHLTANFIDEVEYENLDDRYSNQASREPGIYSTVVKNGNRKTISNYGMAGPVRLWAVEQIIGGLLDFVVWDQK